MSNIEAVEQIVSQVAPQPGAPGPQDQQNPPSPGRDERTSQRLESLIRREQAAIARENAAKEREKGLASQLARIEEFEQARGGNSKKALELLGLNYDQLTESMLKDGEIPPSKMIQELQAQIEELKNARNQDKDQAELMQKRQAEEAEQKAIEGFKSQIHQYLTDNKVRYELIDFEGRQDLVFDVIDEHFKRTSDPENNIPGKVMKIEEAADKVELWLEQKYSKANKVNKIQTLWKAVPTQVLENKETDQKQGNKTTQPPKTLTNNLSATPTQKRTTPISDEERVRRAIAYAQSLRT